MLEGEVLVYFYILYNRKVEGQVSGGCILIFIEVECTG